MSRQAWSNGAKARRDRPVRWPRDPYVTRVEYDAKNDVVFQTLRAEIATFRGEVRSAIGEIRGDIAGMKTQISIILWALALLVALGLVPQVRAMLQAPEPSPARVAIVPVLSPPASPTGPALPDAKVAPVMPSASPRAP